MAALLPDLIACLRDDAPMPPRTTAEWTTLLDLATRQGVAPLLGHTLLTRTSLPVSAEPLRGRLRRLLRHAAMRDLLGAAAYRDLAAGCARAGLPLPVALKGLDLAATVYPSRGLRPMADVDVLVPRDRVPDIVSVARAIGFTPVGPLSLGLDLATAHHVSPLTRRGIALEIHWRLFDPSLHTDRSDTATLIERARPITVDGTEGRGLAPVDLLLHVAAHAAYQHLAEQRLRAVWDVALIVRAFEATWTWDEVVDQAHAWGVARGTALMLTLARNLAEATVPAATIDTLAPGGIPPDIVATTLEQIARPPLPPIGIHVTRLADPRLSMAARLRHLTSRAFLVDQAVRAPAGAREESAPDGAPLGGRLTRPWYLVSSYSKRLWRLRRADRGALRDLATRRNSLERWLSGQVD